MISKNQDYASAVHFALYLAEGMYLSNFGEGGKLAVTTMGEMKKAFSGAHAFQIRSRGPEVAKRIDAGVRIGNRLLEIDKQGTDLRLEAESVREELTTLGESEEPSERRLALLMRDLKLTESMLSLMHEKLILMQERGKATVSMIGRIRRGRESLEG